MDKIKNIFIYLSHQNYCLWKDMDSGIRLSVSIMTDSGR